MQSFFRPLSSIVFLTAASLSTASAALLSTISTTGYNGDVFFETGLADGTTGINARFGARAFFQQGALGDSRGVPTTISKTAVSGNTVNFGFQSFSSNNTLLLSGTNSNTVAQTLTFSAPAAYSNLGLIVSGGALNGAAVGSTSTSIGTLSYVINYVGGGTQTGNVIVTDWGTPNPSTPAAENFFSTNRVETDTNLAPYAASGGTNWSFYLAEITPNSTAAIQSISFTGSRAVSTTDSTITGLGGTGYNSQIGIFGAVGTVIPEPSSALLFAGTAAVSLLRRRRKSSKA